MYLRMLSVKRQPGRTSLTRSCGTLSTYPSTATPSLVFFHKNSTPTSAMSGSSRYSSSISMDVTSSDTTYPGDGLLNARPICSMTSRVNWRSGATRNGLERGGAKVFKDRLRAGNSLTAGVTFVSTPRLISIITTTSSTGMNTSCNT